MTDKERMIEIMRIAFHKKCRGIACTECQYQEVQHDTRPLCTLTMLADALIEAGIGDVTALKERAGSEIKSCYKEIAEKRDETAKLRKQLKRAQNAAKKQKRRAEVAERALATVCEEVLHARYPVESVTVSVVDAFIQRTLKESEKELAEEDKK